MRPATLADIPQATVFGDDRGGDGDTLPVPALSIRGRDWYDGEQLFVPRWVSYLSALRPDRSPEEWQAYFSWAIATGFTGVRIFCGDLGWAGLTPATARERLPGFLEGATARGLAIEVTAITGSVSGYDWRAYLRDILRLCKGYPNVIPEAANEVGHDSQAKDLTFQNILQVLHEHEWDALTVSPGAPVWTDEPDESGHFAGRGGDYQTVHLDRGRDFWNQCRRVREIFACVEAEKIPALDNEPLGADEVDGTVSGKQRSNEPAFFATLGALDRAFQGVGGIHHSQAGLDAVLPGPVQQKCAEAYIDAHAVVEHCLPGVVGQYYNTGFVNGPVGSYPADDWEQLTRHYSFTSGDIGASVIIGLQQTVPIPWANGWAPVADHPEGEWAREGDGSKLQIWQIARHAKARRR